MANFDLGLWVCGQFLGVALLLPLVERLRFFPFCHVLFPQPYRLLVGLHRPGYIAQAGLDLGGGQRPQHQEGGERAHGHADQGPDVADLLAGVFPGGQFDHRRQPSQPDENEDFVQLID